MDEGTVFAMDTPAEGFWREGHFQGHNIWSGGGKNAPFDRPVSRGVFFVVHFALKSVLCFPSCPEVCFVFPPRPEVCFVCGPLRLEVCGFACGPLRLQVCFVCGPLRLEVCFVCGPRRLEVCFV